MAVRVEAFTAICLSREQNMKALVVLSGGQDSTTCLYWALNQPYSLVSAISFNYGQRHSIELASAIQVAAIAGVDHETIDIGPILAGRSPLTDHNEQLEVYSNYEEMDKIIGDRVELTFVPMRNAVFLTLAANRAAAGGYTDIITGVCQQDNANYPDCRRIFIDDMEQMINSALGCDPYAINIRTPLMDLSKAESIRLAQTLPGCMNALAYTHTAYDGKYPPTSKDHASVLRAQGFLEAGVPDPLVVRAWREGLMPLPGTANYNQLAYEEQRDNHRG